MGAEPYRYVVDYQEDVQRALDALRFDVFRRGQYAGAGDGAENPDEALDLAPAGGTRSILDIQFVSAYPDSGCASPLDADELRRCFGTETPTVEQIEASNRFWDSIERGSARYVVIHGRGRPEKLFFAGYSFD